MAADDRPADSVSADSDSADQGRAGPAHTNRLAQESSPYLLQHQHNPVDWYAWGEEAWARARSEGKPVLVSIGYAACHWCHVMERESFEDEAVAARQNELFISIKVDREERPDVDEVYMEAVQLLRQQGGWPLNVFCLPDGRPFFGGTYFPPVGRQGMPSWLQILDAVDAAYRDKRGELEQQASQIVEHLASAPGALELGEERADPAAARRAAASHIMKSYDKQFGGFGGAPKFPQPSFLGLVLQHAIADNHTHARDQVLTTLRQMAEGGNLRPVGRGLSSLLGGRAVAGAALREDVVRQRAAGAAVSGCVAAERGGVVRADRGGDAGLPGCGRCGRRRGAFLRVDGRGLGGGGGQVLRLVAGGGGVVAGGGCGAVRALLRRDGGGQF